MKSTLTAALKALGMASALALAGPAAAQADDIGARLKASGLEYEVDKDGDYKILMNFSSDKRSQLVFVRGVTETANGIVVREIFSAAALVEENKIDGQRALTLMEQSNSNKLGSWEIAGGVVLFVIKFPEPIAGADLRQLILITASVADDMEIVLAPGTDAL